MRLTSCQKVFRTHRHRERRAHRPPPDVLRDARQLLVRRLLQGGRGRVRVGALDERLRLRPRADLDHRLRRRRGARPRARRGGDRVLARDRRARRADRAARARGQLLAVGPDGPVRAVLRALPRPRARLRPGGGPPRRRHGALPRVLEPRLHAVRAASRTARCRRCRRRTSTPGWGSTGWPRSSRTSRRSTRPSTSCPYVRFGEELSGRSYGREDDRQPRGRSGSSPTTAAAWRSCWPTASSPRTRTAATSCAGSCGGRSSRAACSGSSGRSSSTSATSCVEVMGGAYPQLDERARHDRASGRPPRRRASGARSRRARSCCARSCARAKDEEHLLGVGRGGVQAARHLRLPVRADEGAARRGGPGGRRPGLRGADGRGARVARARGHRTGRGRRPRPGARRSRATPGVRDALRRLRGDRVRRR